MIQIKNLTAGYHGKTSVQDVTMDFVPGEVLVFLGPNGSGKSTVMDFIILRQNDIKT